MQTAIKLNVHTITGACRMNQQNQLRYYATMQLFSPNRAGFVDVDSFVAFTAKEFNVKAKTVINNLYKLQKDGYGNMTPTRFYWVGQDKLPYSHNEMSPLAAKITWDMLTDIILWRAHCHQIVLTSKHEQKTIARETLQAVTGYSRKTQIKYEKAIGVEKRYNYGLLGQYRGDKARLTDATYNEANLKQRGNPVFVGTVAVNGSYQSFIMRQIPNTYFTAAQMGKRCYSSKPDKTWGDFTEESTTMGNGYKRIYYQSGKTVSGINRQYRQHHKYGSLWYAYDDGKAH